MNNFYQELISRNWAYINPDDQEKIKNTTILLAGCGLGSNIALLALETGFTKFILVDYDDVEVSNLNRQVFDLRHLGKNKALSLKSILEEKSKIVNIEAYPEKITASNAKKFINKADVIINTVDFDKTNYLVSNIAQENKKVIISPLNIGWQDGLCLTIDSSTPSLADITEGKEIAEEFNFFFSLMNGVKNFKVPSYISDNFENFIKDVKKKKYNPQLGIGAWGTSVVVVDSIVRYILNKQLLMAPNVMTLKDCINLKR